MILKLTSATINRISIFMIAILACMMTYGQTTPALNTGNRLWSNIKENNIRPLGQPWVKPACYQTYALDLKEMDKRLQQAPQEFTTKQGNLISLPMADGNIQRFTLYRSPIQHPKLAEKFPGIQTYSGQGIDDPSLRMRLVRSANGMHAFILGNDFAVSIDPYTAGNTQHYIVYYYKDNRPEFMGACETSDEHIAWTPPFKREKERFDKQQSTTSSSYNRNTGEEIVSLRTYRLAMAVTGLYTQKYGGVDEAFIQIVNRVSDLNVILESETAVRLELIENNDKIIFKNGSDDPYSTDNDEIIDANQTAIDELIGFDNYDIGHVMRRDATVGGLAFVGNVCGGNKAKAVSANDLGVTAHEIGHQLGSRHTFNGALGGCTDNRSNKQAYEPGSGNTIMSYQGLCDSDNLPGGDILHYHVSSLRRFFDFINNTEDGGGTCGTLTETLNHCPVVEIDTGGFYIPVQTPFALVGSAFDLDETDILTYCWEGYSRGPQGSPFYPKGTAAIFRSFPPVAEPVRIFPKMEDIINNEQVMGEVLPTYSRELQFRLTVRDNIIGGGGAVNALTHFEAIEEAGPFTVLQPNTNDIIWTEGSTQTIMWDVSDTDKEPVNCQTVNILLSVDGGYTYPFLLAEDVPNDGSHDIVLPLFDGDFNRIKVEAADNIFFDISNADFTIWPEDKAGYELLAKEENSLVCGESSIDYQIQHHALGNYDLPITLTVTNIPEELAYAFSNDEKSITLNPNETSSLNITNLNLLERGHYTINLEAIDENDSLRLLNLSLYITETPDHFPGNALELTDTNYVIIKDFNWQPQETFSIEWWHYPYSHKNHSQQIGTKWGEFLFHTSSSGQVYVGTSSSSRLSPNNGLGEGTLELNTWQHFAFTYEKGEAKFYKNGVLLAERLGMLPPNKMSFFQLGDKDKDNIDGKIDELRFWTTERTTKEIRENMHLTLDNCTEGLFAYYQFNEDAPLTNSSTIADIIRSYDAEVTGVANSIPASEPVGKGASHTNIEAPDSLIHFSGAACSIYFEEQDKATIVATRIDNPPNTIEGIAENETVFDQQYWVIHRYGGDEELLNTKITFQTKETLTATDEQSPITLALYGRNQTTDTAWTIIGNAAVVNAANNSLTFEHITHFEQYIISRINGPVISLSPIGEFCMTAVGETSDIQSYQVSGDKLKGAVTVRPPLDLEIALTENGPFIAYPQYLSLNSEEKEVMEPVNIYVRFSPSQPETYTVAIKHESEDATTRILHLPLSAGSQTFPSFGNALYLGGGPNRVTIDPGLELYSNTVTIAAWIKPEGKQNDFAGIVFSRKDGTTAGISIKDNNELRYHWNDTGWDFSPGLHPPSGEWSHIALVVTPDSTSLYLNGVPSTHYKGNDIEEFKGRLLIGRDPTGDTRYFKGYIDEVAIWNRSLTTEEIREKMHLTRSVGEGCSDDLIVYYQFDGDPDSDHCIEPMSGFTGKLTDGASKKPSSVPIGRGYSDIQYNAGGATDFEKTDADLDFGITNDEVVFFKLNAGAYGREGLPLDIIPLDNQYWIAQSYDNNSIFNIDARFYVTDHLTAEHEANPESIALYGRPHNGDGIWELLRTAKEVETNNKEIYFENIKQDGQYLLTRQTCYETGLVKVDIKLLLEGAYSTTIHKMEANLPANDLLPDQHPFSDFPWDYLGGDQMTYPFANAVDWVMVEIRHWLNKEEVIDRKVALVRNDGRLMETDGTTGLNFECIQSGIYHIAIRHRNHVDIITANPYYLPNTTVINLSNPSTVANGSEQLVKMEGISYAMRVGDTNGDGVITNSDYTFVQQSTGLLQTYHPADLNMDGHVTVEDINLIKNNASHIGVKEIRY